jgi:hypothetical protein
MNLEMRLAILCFVLALVNVPGLYLYFKTSLTAISICVAIGLFHLVLALG